MGYHPLWINDKLIDDIIRATSIENAKVNKFFVNKGFVRSYHI